MPWMMPSVIATTAGTLVLSAVYWFLYVQYRERFVGIWAWSWLIYAFRFIVALWKLQAGQSPLSLIVNQMFTLVSGLFLVWGTYVFQEKRMPRWWLAGGVLDGIWIIFATFARLPFLWTSLPTFGFLALVYIWTGLVFLRFGQAGELGRRVTGWTLVLWGVHKGNYPFLRPVIWFAPWGYLIGALLEFVLALSMLLVYFQKMRRDLIVSEERFRSLVEQSSLGIGVSQGERVHFANRALAWGCRSPTPSSETTGDGSNATARKGKGACSGWCFLSPPRPRAQRIRPPPVPGRPPSSPPEISSPFHHGSILPAELSAYPWPNPRNFPLLAAPLSQAYFDSGEMIP